MANQLARKPYPSDVTDAQWGAERQEHFLLSRRAFAALVKAHGCSPDRTNTAHLARDCAEKRARDDNM